MKSTTKKLLLPLALVVSFLAVQAVWADPDCSTIVQGTVSDILVDDNAVDVYDITTDESTTVYGIPLPWVDIQVDDTVLINAHECPDTGKLMACYLEINEDGLYELRPKLQGWPKNSGGKQ